MSIGRLIKPLPRQSQFFFFAILAGLFFLSWVLFKPFLIFMVTGVFVAVLALPIDKWWEKVFPNRVAAFFTMFTLLLIILVPLLALGFALANDAQALSQNLQDGAAQDWVDGVLDGEVVQKALEWAYPGNTTEERNATVQGWLENGEKQAVEWLKDFSIALVQRLPELFIGLVVILFVVYYVLTDGQRLVTYIRRAAPLPAQQVDRLLAEAHGGLRAVFVGQILTSAIQGAVGGISFLIAGVPGAIIWASVMAVLSLLPVVGAFLVWIPATIYVFADGRPGMAIFLLVWNLVLTSQVDNFIRPKLIGDRANIHPLFVLIGVLGGVTAFGFIGLFLGPLLVGVTISILKVWEEDYLDPSVGQKDPTHEEPPAPPTKPPRRARWWRRKAPAKDEDAPGEDET